MSLEKQIKFSDFIGTEIEQYIKEGSLKSIQNAEEIYIKIPHWNDVKLSWFIHGYLALYEGEISYFKYNYLVTTLKVKVVDGDNSGYKKYYFVQLCWNYNPLSFEPPLEYTTIEDCLKTIQTLLKYPTFHELETTKEKIFYCDLGGSGV